MPNEVINNNNNNNTHLIIIYMSTKTIDYARHMPVCCGQNYRPATQRRTEDYTESVDEVTWFKATCTCRFTFDKTVQSA